jgi:tetratricopeptide (TPR) repeat protein
MRHYLEADARPEAALHADVAATHAFAIGATSEAVDLYRQAYELDPTPTRKLELGYALMHTPGSLLEARRALMDAFAAFETQQDQEGIVQAGLRLAVSFLSTEEGEHVLDWAEQLQRAVPHDSANIELQATIQYLMAAGKFHTQDQMSEADAHYAMATRLATEHNLVSDIAIQSWFGWGNFSLQSGDFVEAQTKFMRTLEIARRVGNIYFEALCYNNLSYAALLAQDLLTAERLIETGLTFIHANGLLRPRQYLYSTRGEVSLAAKNLSEAESWFMRALAEADTYDNTTHTINIRAHLGRVARARGDFDQAEQLLSEARHAIPPDGALFLRHKIDLWTAELYLERNEKQAAQEILSAAQKELAGTKRKALQHMIEELSAQLDTQ